MGWRISHDHPQDTPAVWGGVRVTGYACPVCGDPRAFPVWIDAEPPVGCPHDDAWMNGNAPAIRTVTECRYQMGKARQAAEFRRLVPDAFDADGKMLPGRLADVLTAFSKAHPTELLVI